MGLLEKDQENYYYFFLILGKEGLVEGFPRSVKSLASFIVVSIKPLVFKHWTINGAWVKGNK